MATINALPMHVTCHKILTIRGTLRYKDRLSKYMDSRYKDNTVMRLFYLYNHHSENDTRLHKFVYQRPFRVPLQWRHNGYDDVSNHRRLHCLLNRLLRSKKTSKLHVTGLCEGNSPVTDEFPARRASNMENVSIWWRHHTHIPTPSTHLKWSSNGI